MPPVKKSPKVRRRHFLKEWREFLDITQEVAADRARISRGNLSKIESGAVPYNQDVVERLAEAYGCEVSDMIERSPLWNARIPIFDLPASDIERVREFVAALRVTRSGPVPTSDAAAPEPQVVPRKTAKRVSRKHH